MRLPQVSSKTAMIAAPTSVASSQRERFRDGDDTRCVTRRRRTGNGWRCSNRRYRLAHHAGVGQSSGSVDRLADVDGLTCVRCDVTDGDSVDTAVTEVESTLGNVEILVSNAGITRDGLVLRMSEDDFADVVDANLTGGFRVAKRVVKGMMRGRWG